MHKLTNPDHHKKKQSSNFCCSYSISTVMVTESFPVFQASYSNAVKLVRDVVV